MASFPFRPLPVRLRLPFDLRPLLQRHQQHPEQRVLVQQAFRGVRQLLQPPHRLPELPAFLPVLLLQAPPLPAQLRVLRLQAEGVEGQPAIVAPQLRQLSGEALAGVTQRLHLSPERRELGAEDGAGSRARRRFGGVRHGAGVLQDEVKQVG